MKDKDKTKDQLIRELKGMRQEVAQLKAVTAHDKFTEKKLRESEMQYRTTIDSMGSAIHVVDLDLKIIFMNKALKRWLNEIGLQTDIIGRTIFDAFPHLPDKILDEYLNVVATGKPLATEENTEVNGRALVTEARKIPVFERGRVVRIVTVIRDITERKQVEERLAKSMEGLKRSNEELVRINLELEQVAQSKPEFLSFVSHELRTPLMSLGWSAKCLKRILAGVEIENTQHLLGIITDDSEKLDTLIHQLLEFSKIEAKKLRLEIHTESILPVIRRVIAIKKERIGNREIRFNIAAPRKLAKARFDPKQIELVLENLVDNSLKYSHAKATIAISLKQHMVPKPELEIRVKDNGIGIPESNFERVFEKFHRGSQKEVLETSGTGLGLSICKAIVEAHRGKIWVEKPAKKGCTIAFTLPVVSD